MRPLNYSISQPIGSSTYPTNLSIECWCRNHSLKNFISDFGFTANYHHPLDLPHFGYPLYKNESKEIFTNKCRKKETVSTLIALKLTGLGKLLINSIFRVMFSSTHTDEWSKEMWSMKIAWDARISRFSVKKKLYDRYLLEISKSTMLSFYLRVQF